MGKKWIYLVIIPLSLFLGCAVNKPLEKAGDPEKPLSDPTQLVFNPVDAQALPVLRDLPQPQGLQKTSRHYTGIIKNKTRYDLYVPSGNSSATLMVPAKGWIEYEAWSRNFDLTAYRDGQPFYCLRIFAYPKKYPFMCKKYDFIAEIEKPEPIQKKKLKKRKVKPKPA